MKKLLFFALLLTSMHTFAQPSNNECAMSTNVAVSTMMTNTYTANTVAATETAEGTCQSPSFTDPDVWFNFNMPVNENVQITGITNNNI